MTWRKKLTEAQIAATLERHGVPDDAEVIGIYYSDVATTVNVRAGRRVQRLIVPTDILNARTVPDMNRQARGALFEHRV